MWTAAGTRLLTAHVDVLLFFENGKLLQSEGGGSTDRERQTEIAKERKQRYGEKIEMGKSLAFVFSENRVR